MRDLISRNDAIELFESYIGLTMKADDAHHQILYILSSLPSVKPERKKGRWQRRRGSGCWECSECHAVLESDDIVRHNFYYCYHCGADMMNEDGYMKLEGTEHE